MIEDSRAEKASRVLVVEDEPLVQFAVKNMLKKLGCAADVADNGEAAVRMIQRQNISESTRYGLVLMDINMPVMNGYVATKTLNAMIGSQQIFAVPIVCLSAQDSPEHVARCKESGFVEQSTSSVRYSWNDS